MSTHQFALYTQELPTGAITDPALVHRIQQVLRLAVGETVTLFTRHEHTELRITSMGKKEIGCTTISRAPNTILKPAITVLLPLLKREALESALYSCAEMGATEVQLLITEKTPAHTGKDLERFERIMIAAAEQSKQFAMPILNKPVKLATVHGEPVESIRCALNHNIFFDPTGTPLFEVLQTLHTQQPDHITLMIGPAGDLTQQEKDILIKHNFTFCALTPTVLRAEQALAVGLGVFRSINR